METVTLTKEAFDALIAMRDEAFAERETFKSQLKTVTVERDLLQEKLKAFLRKLFDAKSEVRGADQKDMFFNEAEALAPAGTPVTEEVTPEIEVAGHMRKKRGRKPLDPNLPRDIVRHELPESERICAHDGSALVEIGVEISEQLDIILQQVRVIQHQRVATQFIAAIGELYAVESKAKDKSATERQRLRDEFSRPILARIEAMLLQHLHAVMPGSLLGKALHYLSAQWPKLSRYVENGAWPIDNNLCENAIRPFVVGRRNWLFADTVAGANASANLYSLIETCKAQRIDPYGYLVSLFLKLPSAQTADDFEALLPWHLASTG